MAAQRQFQTAAQRRAVDRRDDGLLDGVEMIDDGDQMRFAGGLIEFADVGAGGKGAPGADQNDGLDRLVGRRPVDLFH
jgi:hypothetical protein